MFTITVIPKHIESDNLFPRQHLALSVTSWRDDTPTKHAGPKLPDREIIKVRVRGRR
jgi:hypothetical protein